MKFITQVVCNGYGAIIHRDDCPGVMQAKNENQKLKTFDSYPEASSYVFESLFRPMKCEYCESSIYSNQVLSSKWEKEVVLDEWGKKTPFSQYKQILPLSIKNAEFGNSTFKIQIWEDSPTISIFIKVDKLLINRAEVLLKKDEKIISLNFERISKKDSYEQHLCTDIRKNIRGVCDFFNTIAEPGDCELLIKCMDYSNYALIHGDFHSEMDTDYYNPEEWKKIVSKWLDCKVLKTIEIIEKRMKRKDNKFRAEIEEKGSITVISSLMGNSNFPDEFFELYDSDNKNYLFENLVINYSGLFSKDIVKAAFWRLNNINEFRYSRR